MTIKYFLIAALLFIGFSFLTNALESQAHFDCFTDSCVEGVE